MPKAHEPGTPRSHSLTTRPPPVHAKRVRADLSCHRKPCADRSWRFCSAKKKKKREARTPFVQQECWAVSPNGLCGPFLHTASPLAPSCYKEIVPMIWTYYTPVSSQSLFWFPSVDRAWQNEPDRVDFGAFFF